MSSPTLFQKWCIAECSWERIRRRSWDGSSKDDRKNSHM